MCIRDSDNAVLDFLAESFAKEHGVDLKKDKMSLQRLKEAAEKAKIELSSAQTTNINLPFITVTNEGPLHLNMDLTRAKFDQLTADLVKRTIEPMKKACLLYTSFLQPVWCIQGNVLA